MKPAYSLVNVMGMRKVRTQKHSCTVVQESQSLHGPVCAHSTNVNRKDYSCPKKKNYINIFPVCPKIAKPKLNINQPPFSMVIIALLDSMHNNNGLNLLKVARKSITTSPCSWQRDFVPQLKMYAVAGYTASALKHQSLQKKMNKACTIEQSKLVDKGMTGTL